MELEKICEKIKERRKVLNLTQKDLADALHVSDKLVSKWETGESVPLLEYLQPLSEVLQISVQELMSLDSSEQPSSEQPAAEQCASAKPKKQNKDKSFWKKNRKPIIISIIAVAAVLIITAVTLLSVFVFVPKANKKKYLEAIDNGIDRYLELGYFNIKATKEVDGDEDKSPRILQGYIDEDGNVAYYNSVTGEIVKDGVKTEKYGSSQYDYVQPANIITVSDLLKDQLKSWNDNEDDLFDIEEYVTHIRKTSYGYYMEFNEEYVTHELKPSELKNIKFTDKIKGRVEMDGNKTKSIAVTVKFHNTKENEDFTIVGKIEFLQTKPVIEHKNYVQTANAEFATKERFLQLLGGSSISDTIEDNLKYLLSSNNLRYENGYLFEVNSRSSITFYDPNTLAVTKTIPATNVTDATIYNGTLWYVYAVTSSCYDLYKQDLNADKAVMMERDIYGKIKFNGRYFYCTGGDSFSSTGIGFVYDLKQEERIATSYFIKYVDKDGTVYCRNDYDDPLYVYGKTNLKLNCPQIWKEEDGYVYTRIADGNNGPITVSQYKAGELIKTAIINAETINVQSGYYFADGSNILYDLDGNVVAELPKVALKVPDSYNGYVELYVKITAVYDDVVMVKFTYKDNNYTTNVSQYMGFYRIGKWDEPVAFVELRSQSVTVRKYKDTTYLIISNDDSSTSDYRDKEYWVIQG